MKKDYKNLHQWDVLAISCIDGRFIKQTIDWISERTDGTFDFRTEVGSSKAIVDSLPDRERLFELINVSIRLHDIQEVWLINHIDCGAYGGSKNFENIEKEKEFHFSELNKAKEYVNAGFPKLGVRRIFVDWEGIEEIK